MAGNKDIPKVPNPPSGDGHHITHRYMTATELAERADRQKSYDDMLARQAAFEKHRQVFAKNSPPPQVGCVFAKSCNLPNAIIDYSNPSGAIPTDALKHYGNLILLGAHKADESGLVRLKKISGSAMPASIGSLALGGSAVDSMTLPATGVVAGTLAGLVALLWPSTLGENGGQHHRQSGVSTGVQGFHSGVSGGFGGQADTCCT